MMKFFLMSITIGAALFAEWNFLKFFASPPPLGVFVTLIWFFSLSFSQRLFLALIVGGILDSMSIFPFGTHILTLCLLAFFFEKSLVFFSDATLPFQKLVIASNLFFLFFLLVPLSAWGAAALGGGAFIWTARAIPQLLLSGIAWSIFLPILFVLSSRRTYVSSF